MARIERHRARQRRQRAVEVAGPPERGAEMVVRVEEPSATARRPGESARWPRPSVRAGRARSPADRRRAPCRSLRERGGEGRAAPAQSRVRSSSTPRANSRVASLATASALACPHARSGRAAPAPASRSIAKVFIVRAVSRRRAFMDGRWRHDPFSSAECHEAPFPPRPWALTLESSTWRPPSTRRGSHRSRWRWRCSRPRRRPSEWRTARCGRRVTRTSASRRGPVTATPRRAAGATGGSTRGSRRSARARHSGRLAAADDEWRGLAAAYGGLREETADKGRAAFDALIAGGRSEFEAVFGGGRELDGQSTRGDAHGFYWTASETGPSTAWFYNLGRGGLSVNRHAGGEKQSAFAVRCVRD